MHTIRIVALSTTVSIVFVCFVRRGRKTVQCIQQVQIIRGLLPRFGGRGSLYHTAVLTLYPLIV